MSSIGTLCLYEDCTEYARFSDGLCEEHHNAFVNPPPRRDLRGMEKLAEAQDVASRELGKRWGATITRVATVAFGVFMGLLMSRCVGLL